MKKLLIFFFVCFTISCSNPGVRVTVKNSSDEAIDSVIVTNGFDVAKFKTLNKNDKGQEQLIFSGRIK